MKILHLSAFALVSALFVTGCPSLELNVNTNKGPVEGILVGNTRAFLGIPYAAPPIGALRWKSPAPHAPWTATLRAAHVGAPCPQIDQNTGKPLTYANEDCLTLNIWAPAELSAHAAPVMVWLHGGGFSLGSGSDPAFNGQHLSEESGNIVVTINYRLGALGFLAHAGLTAENPNHRYSGNYGFEDQREALRWVQTNIARFGGDPQQVTLFGESAGGISSCLHVLSPQSDGLFQRVIDQSGPCTFGSSSTPAQVEAHGAEFAEKLNCTSAANVAECLRAKTPDEITSTLPFQPSEVISGRANWAPYVDGFNIPEAPAVLLAQGKFKHIPILIGTNKDEGTALFAGTTPPTTQAEYQTLMDNISGGHGAEIVARYPIAQHGSAWRAAAAALGDALFVCPTRSNARAFAKAGVPTYLYHFTHEVTSPSFPNFGAFHSSEIPFIFGNPYLDITLTPAEQKLAFVMQSYWGNMAKNATPNAQNQTFWPRYETATEKYQILDLNVSSGSDLKASECGFWALFGI